MPRTTREKVLRKIKQSEQSLEKVEKYLLEIAEFCVDENSLEHADYVSKVAINAKTLLDQLSEMYKVF